MSFERIKRCIEVSPSAPRTLKSSKVNEPLIVRSSRRGINFGDEQPSGKKENRCEPLESLETPTTAQQEHTTESRVAAGMCVTEEEMMDMFLSKIDRELVHVARRETKSVLRDRGYPGLSNFTFEEILAEMRSLCPTVFTILSNMIQLDLNQDKNTAPLALIYGVVMFKRFHELSRVQRLNTVLLYGGNASKELMERLNRYGISMVPTMKYKIQENIGSHFLDLAVQMVKEGKTFVLVLDNIDWELKVHDMRSDKQNKSVHAVATSIVFDRIASDLPNNGPKKCLSDCNMKDLLKLSDEEQRCTRECYKIYIGRILCELFPAFEFLNGVVPVRTPCRYRAEMSSESVVVPLPVLMKDEKKYAEVVDVLDQLEVWVREIYSRAGMCAPPDEEHVPPGPPIAAPSRPDQPASHVPPVPQPDDPLANVKVPCFGDQLTRVRLAGAKDLRAGSHTPQDRLDHLYPYRIVDWHTEKLLEAFSDDRQVFHSGSTGAVLWHGTKDGRITRNRPPYYILDVDDNKRQYYDSVLDKCIEEFLITPPTNDDEESSPDSEDFVRNYSLCLLKYYFLIFDFKDAVKEGNGERIATLHKHLLSHFKALPGFNNYAIEMLISVVQNNVFLSEAEAHQCIWASTVNWKGGAGKNIEIDLLQENRDKSIKKAIKSMGPNKTDNAIDKSSRASGGEDKIGENFDVQIHRATQTSSHSHRSTDADESIVMENLRVVKPFAIVPNRMHDSFPDILPDPLVSLDQTELDKWLARHKRNLLLDAPLGLDDEEDS
ncbi:hypothetical protein OS493_006962 [Desmophyllum pertusum]|uniref:DUF6589 domain-containing protein n=1 Tax=Desmophyllum pertusum TaxID=174260 RepID=A0A9W9ZFB9_9CNID|nr:hypothetical protein OS493_006962 [Desmophyllum pertusum]